MSMALMLREGDYVSDGQGGLVTVTGARELLERVLWKLTLRRGSFPFLPELGSRLHLLGQAKAAQREALARRYVEEALADEELTVTGVGLSQEEGRALPSAELAWQGEELTVTVELGGLG